MTSRWPNAPDIPLSHRDCIDAIRRILGLHCSPEFCASIAASLLGGSIHAYAYKGIAIETIITHLASEPESFCVALYDELECQLVAPQPQCDVLVLAPVGLGQAGTQHFSLVSHRQRLCR